MHPSTCVVHSQDDSFQLQSTLSVSDAYSFLLVYLLSLVESLSLHFSSSWSLELLTELEFDSEIFHFRRSANLNLDGGQSSRGIKKKGYIYISLTTIQR